MRTERRDRAATSKSLWFAMLGGPVAWALHEQLSYALVPPACYGGNAWPHHLLTVIALTAAVGAGLVALRAYAHNGGEGRGAPRYMAATGLLTSMLFTCLILLEWLPTLLMSPCW